MQPFEHTFKINETCQLRISGIWQKVNGEIEYSVDSVEASFGGKIWSNIPYSVIEWLGGNEKVDEIAYTYITNMGDAPDTVTDIQQDHYCQVNNLID